MDEASTQIQNGLKKVEHDLGLRVVDRAESDRTMEKVEVGVFWIVQMQEQAEHAVEAPPRFGLTTDFNLLKFAYERYPKLDVQGYHVLPPRYPKTYNVYAKPVYTELLSQTYGFWYENGSLNDKDIVIGASGYFLEFLGVLTDPFFRPKRPYESLNTLQDSEGLDIKRYEHSCFDFINGRKEIGSNFWIVRTDNDDGSTLSYDVSTSVGHITALVEREAPEHEVTSYLLTKNEWKIAWFRTFYIIGEEMVGIFAHNPANMTGSTSRLAKILWKNAWRMAQGGERVDSYRAVTPIELSKARKTEQMYYPGAKSSGQDEFVAHACRILRRNANKPVFFKAPDVD